MRSARYRAPADDLPPGGLPPIVDALSHSQRERFATMKIQSKAPSPAADRSKSSFNRIVRLIHHWTSIVVIVTGGLVVVTGLLLLLKKDVDMIQPLVMTASKTGPSDASSIQIFDAARAGIPNLSWKAVDRIDIRTRDGVAKVVTKDYREVQVDLHNLEVLSVRRRNSDMLEQLHDGSFFGPWVKYGLMIPSGIALLVLWATGTYLFVIVRTAQLRKAWRKHRSAKSTRRAN